MEQAIAAGAVEVGTALTGKGRVGVAAAVGAAGIAALVATSGAPSATNVGGSSTNEVLVNGSPSEPED